MLAELLDVAAQADGVRCDMAMLGLSQVFEQLWGRDLPRDGRLASEFWSMLIRQVKQRHPEFLFIAEAYWGLEARLLDLGFDYVYDKRLYDLQLGTSALAIRQHLSTSGQLLQRAVRFIENHDERRATAAFGRERSQAAAIATMTLPGLRLVQDGQVEGKRIRLPLQLVREPIELLDHSMIDFYDRLLALTDDPTFHEGTWTLLDVGPAVLWDESHHSMVAWSWSLGSRHYLIALSSSNAPARGRLCQLQGASWPPATWRDALDPLSPGPGPCRQFVDLAVSPGSCRIIVSRSGTAPDG